MKISAFLKNVKLNHEYNIVEDTKEIKAMLQHINDLSSERKEQQYSINGYYLLSGNNLKENERLDEIYNLNPEPILTNLDLSYWFFEIMLKKNQNIEKISFDYDKKNKTIILMIFCNDKLYSTTKITLITKKLILQLFKEDTFTCEYCCYYLEHKGVRGVEDDLTFRYCDGNKIREHRNLLTELNYAS